MKKSCLFAGLIFLLMAGFTQPAQAAICTAVGASGCEGYHVTAGATMSITEFGICKKVTNSLAKDVFVPTKTQAEWTAFYTNFPNTVTVTACAPPLPCAWVGGTVADSASVTAYQSSAIALPGTCASISQTRACTNGTLSGTYAYATCNAKTVSFNPGNGAYSSSDVLTAARVMNTAAGVINPTPATGGTISLNGVPVGLYDYAIKDGDQTISSFVSTDWFTNVGDSHSAWITVNGNLTINAGQTFTPPVRKLFTVLYVSGNLTVNGAISMTARGASHGGLVNAGNILIAAGTYSGVTNPQVPATGGFAGGTRGAGGAGGAGGTGGGGGGGGAAAAITNGSWGTSYSGGSGGGGDWSNAGSGGAASAAGNGAGGGPGYNSGWYANGGGAGNPGGGGYAATGWANAGGSGTGGVLIILVEGTYSGSGTVSADGVAGGNANSAGYGSAGGGGSGGGSVTVLSGADAGPVPTANGGAGGSAEGSLGGPGGVGTARKLNITPSAPCGLPWGGSITSGTSVTAYAASSVGCGGSCASETRTCTNGTLSGSYTASSCSVAACSACALPWGGAIAHGASVTAYAASSVGCAGTCTSQTRTCNNGSLSGSYGASGCSVGSCGDCGPMQVNVARPLSTYHPLGNMSAAACFTACSAYAGASCCEWQGNGDCYAEEGNCTPAAVGGWNSADCAP